MRPSMMLTLEAAWCRERPTESVQIQIKDSKSMPRSGSPESVEKRTAVRLIRLA